MMQSHAPGGKNHVTAATPAVAGTTAVNRPSTANPVKYQNRQSPPFRSGGRGSKQVSAALEQSLSQDPQPSCHDMPPPAKQYVLFFGRSSPCFARIISEHEQHSVMLQPLRPNPIDPKLLIPWEGHLWLAKRDKIRPVQMKQHAFGLELKADDFVLSYMQFRRNSQLAFVYPTVLNKTAQTNRGIAQDDNWDVISLESSEYDDSSKMDFSLFPQFQNNVAPSSSSSSGGIASSSSISSNGNNATNTSTSNNGVSGSQAVAAQQSDHPAHPAPSSKSFHMNTSSPSVSRPTDSEAGTPGSRSQSSINTTPSNISTASKGPIKLSKPAIPMRGPVTSTPNFWMKPLATNNSNHNSVTGTSSKSGNKDVTPSSLQKNLSELKSRPASSPSEPVAGSAKSRSDSITSELPAPSTILPIEVVGDSCNELGSSETSQEEYLTFAKTIYRVGEDFRLTAQQLLFQPSHRPPLARSSTPQSRSSSSTPVQHDTSPDNVPVPVAPASCSTPTNRSQLAHDHLQSQAAKYASPVVVAQKDGEEYSAVKTQLEVSKTPMEANGIAVLETLPIESDSAAAIDTVDPAADSDDESQSTTQQEADNSVEMEVMEIAVDTTEFDVLHELPVVEAEVAGVNNAGSTEIEPVETVASAEEVVEEVESITKGKRGKRGSGSNKAASKKNDKKAVIPPANMKTATPSGVAAPSPSSSSKPPLHPVRNHNTDKPNNHSSNSNTSSNASKGGKKRSRAELPVVAEPPPRRSRPQTISFQNKRDSIFGSWPTRKQSAATGSWSI